MVQWLAESWFDIVQTLGIAGSLFYAGRAFSLDRRMRSTEVLLYLTQAHRSIWERMIEHPELGRVLEPEADIETTPPSVAETRFVKLVLLHLSEVRSAVANKAYRPSPELDEDVRKFLSLPIPRAVLDTFLPYQDQRLRDYVRSLLER